MTLPFLNDKAADWGECFMKRRRRRRRGGGILIFLGIALIAAAAGLFAYNIWDGRRAAAASQAIVEALDDLESGLENTPAPAPRRRGRTDVDDRVNGGDPFYFEDKEMPTETIDGYRYIGTLELPSLGLRLPVMDQWDYTRLKISPCLYSGSYFTDDMVICAHNYERHFSPVKWIDIGADVYFVTVDKVVYHYTVSNRETLQPTAVSTMVENQNNTNGMASVENWDLTLFTCNTGGQTRCAVRCVRAAE